MCIAYDYAYFTNHGFISGHNPNTHIINSYRKSSLTKYLMDIETDVVILFVSQKQ